MTISELEQQLVDMGFKIRFGEDNYYYYIDDLDNNCYAYISNKDRFVIDTDTDWFNDLQTKKRKRLFNILIEFAATPLNRRQNVKYYVTIEYKGCFGGDRTFWVSDYNSFTEDYELSSKYQDAGKFDEEAADKIMGMLPNAPIIKKTKVSVE